MPTDILDTYDILDTLHQSAATAVYIVRHKKLNEVRILKSSKKDERNSSEILSEANLLSGYHYTGIPTIFDYYSDETTDYLVEQYIQGSALSEVMLRRVLTINEVVDITIRLCEIINHLHTHGEKPIVYRDLKPEHIILSEGTVWLIDYGIAVEEGIKCRPMGTKGFAAPEQMRGELPHRTNDIYALGCVLKTITEQIPDKEKRLIKDIISHSMCDDVNDRYASVAEMKLELSKKKARINKIRKGTEHLVKKIAVIGAAEGVGCTFFSICLTVFMNSVGIRSYYVDKSEERVLQNLADNRPEIKQKDGIIYHNKFYGWLEYGPAVEKITPPEGLFIEDCGVAKRVPEEADIVVLILSGMPWKKVDDLPEYVNDENVIFITQMSTRADALCIARKYKRKVISFPMCQNPFRLDKQALKVLQRVKKLIL